MSSLLAALALSGAIKPLSPQAIVLTYHDVIERRDAHALWFDCSTAELTQQLDWLANRGAHFITLDQLVRHLKTGESLPPHPVAITFADNYEGFYVRAWPILKAKRIPCAMFVHTGFVGSRVGRPKMTWAQLQELDRSGLVTISSQTVTHRSVTTLPSAEVNREFIDSKRSLESHLGHAIQYLAYPNGAFDSSSAQAAERAGYAAAFTERLTPAERSPDLFRISRYVHTRYRQAWAGVAGPARTRVPRAARP